MGPGRWFLVAVTTSVGRRRVSAGPPAEAFVNHRLLSSLLSSSAPLRVHPRITRRLQCSSTTQPAASIIRHSRTAMATAGAGESWCGHDLLNTVTTAWVALVDIRGQVVKHRDEGSDFFSTRYEGMEADYLDAHIPGAVFVDWTKDIAHTDENGVPAQLTDRESFVIAMEERGVGAAKRVVVYDNGDMLFATRFWWAMRRFGHDRVAVMDGGWAKWQAEERDITPDCPCPLKVYTEWGIPPERERPGLMATSVDVRAALARRDRAGGGSDGQANDAVQLLDARAAAQYTGEVRRARLGGHIPGAVNTPYRSFLAEGTGPDGSFRVFKGLEGITEVFESAAVDTSPSAAPIIAYCNGGVASTVALFLLFQLRELRGSGDGAAAAASGGDSEGSGRGSWANFDGSWNEWGNDELAPVERS
ncbi:unnamed protein product [Ectocarpus fasciculatus]